MTKTLVIHPFIACVLPLVMGIAQIASLCPWIEMLPGCVVMECVALVLFVIFYLVFKDARKAGIVVTVTTILFFCFIPIQFVCTLFSFLLANRVCPDPILVAVTFVVMAFCSWLATRDKLTVAGKSFEPDFDTLTNSLNVVCALLLVFNVFTIFQGATLGSNNFAGLQRKLFSLVEQTPVHSNSVANAKPDIYYLVFDSMPSAFSLKKEYGLVSTLPEWLKSKGFYVADHSCSNYDRTNLSIGSTLNLQYVNDFIEAAAKKEISEVDFDLKLCDGDNCVKRFMKQLGYEYHSIYGDVITDYTSPQTRDATALFAQAYMLQIMNLTPLRTATGFLRELWAVSLTAPLGKLPALIASQSPKFVYIHVMLNHGPWVFDSDGQIVDVPQGATDAFANQYRYSEKCVKRAVEQVLANSANPPIVIVQGDHGLYNSTKDFDVYRKTRMRILNAYLLPGTKDNNLYSSITPVNSFRVVLNKYFNANLPLLKDENFCGPNINDMSNIKNVTDLVKY